MIKRVIVGVNSTGKSEKLLEDFNLDESSKKLYIPTEMVLDEEIKSSNKAKGTFVIDNILPIIFDKIDVDMTEKKQTLMDEINTGIADLNNPFISKFSFNSRWNYEKMLENDIKNEFNSLGSGDKSKYIFEMLDQLDLDGYSLYIDEPEKFAHPNLQKEISLLLNNLSNNNDIYIVTHSPLLVQGLKINELNIIQISTSESTNSISDSDLKSYLEEISDSTGQSLYDSDNNQFNAIEKFNDFLNINFNMFIRYYFMNIYKQLIFMTKVVFVEDINTEFYVNEILEAANLSSVDCINVGGKIMLLFWNKVCEALKITNGIIYDNDKRITYTPNQPEGIFNGVLGEADTAHCHYNEILSNIVNSQEVTIDIEHSVLGYKIYSEEGRNEITKRQMQDIKDRKTRIDIRLEIKKLASEAFGYNYVEILSLIESL